MTDNVSRFPIKTWQKICNKRGRFSVSCAVSERWLRFSSTSASTELGSVVWVDVLTDVADGTRKLCTLAITLEDLRKALDNIDAGA